MVLPSRRVKRNACNILKSPLLFITCLFTCCILYLVLDETKPVYKSQCVQDNNCHHHAQCFSTLNSYVCKCEKGFYGDGIHCEDINECKQGLSECNKKNTECFNNIGSYYCDCKNGYSRKHDDDDCLDLNECKQTPSPCSQNALCGNLPGSYNCTCLHGYTGNGKYCEYNPKNCIIPKHPLYRNCEQKVRWLSQFWKSHPCYQRLGVDGTTCSYLQFLSEVEHECPLMPGRHHNKIKDESGRPLEAELERFDNNTLLLHILHDARNFEWIKERISFMWNDWVKSFKALASKQNLQRRRKKNILVFIGILADKQWSWAANAKKGGPLGELVQWADLIASVYLLGHNLFVTTNAREIESKKISGSPCGDQKVTLNEFDVIYIDIHGIHMFEKQGIDINILRCKFRVLDSFGTEARFNFMDPIDESEASVDGSVETAKKLGSNPYGYGDLKLNLKQFLTMFPHSPDNSFLGFVVGLETHRKVDMSKKEDIALIYGKQNYMFEGKTPFLSVLTRHISLHGTILPDAIYNKAAKKTNRLFNVAGFITNHGLMPWDELQLFLEKTKVFVGLGFPFEGPAPLEAIAKGAVFLNPKWNPPLNRLNDKIFNKKMFFNGKPTLRKFTSQHSYMETFIGKPYVYTIDINNKTQVHQTIIEILNNFHRKKINPYLPYEFTNEGMLQRLNAYIENQNFCNTDSTWPSKEALRVVFSRSDESCKDACMRKGFICDNALFTYLKSRDIFEEYGINCASYALKNSLLAPYVKFKDDSCTLQKEPLLFSCIDSAKYYRRLCPCREFIKGQVALSPGFV